MLGDPDFDVQKWEEEYESADDDYYLGKISRIERFRRQRKAGGFIDEETSDMYVYADGKLSEIKAKFKDIVGELVETWLIPRIREYGAGVCSTLCEYLEIDMDSFASGLERKSEKEERVAKIDAYTENLLTNTRFNLEGGFQHLIDTLPKFSW